MDHSSHWHRHPAVRSGDQLTRGERAADAILLIAAKREDQINSDLAMHDYETNQGADEIVKSIKALTEEIHAKVVGDGQAG